MSSAATTMSHITRSRPALIAFGAVIVIASFAFIANIVFEDEAMWKEHLSTFLEQARGTPWALPMVVAAYVFGSLVFFPVILLNLVCAIVFGLWGIVYALVGAMANVAIYFMIGHFMRGRYEERLMSYPSVKTVDEKLEQSGLAGVVMIHLLPAPPFVITNLIAGISSISFLTFATGSLLSLLPGAIGRGLVGDSLTKILLDPTPETYLYFGAGIAVWLSLVAGMHIYLKRYQAQAIGRRKGRT